MVSRKMQHAALVTREAHAAVLELKKLIDNAAEETRTAERETVGEAVGSSHPDRALRTLRQVADKLGSPDFDAVLSHARMKIDTALASHLAHEGL